MRRLWYKFLTLFFRLLYNRCAWAYDSVSWLVSLGAWKAWGRTVTPYIRGQRVLELAHGPGHLLVTMERAGYDPVGVDISPAMGHLANRRWRHAARTGQIEPSTAPLVQALAQALPFRSDSFDSLVSTFPTEFIFESATMQEAARVIRPEGRFVIALQARPGKENGCILFRLLDWLYRVTGQAEPLPLDGKDGEDGESRFRSAPFTFDIAWVEHTNGRVMILVAEREAQAS